MKLQRRVYSVLIVSASTQADHALRDLLPELQFDPVHTVASIAAAGRATAERSYDFVILNSPLPDDSGVSFAVDCCRSAGTVVLLLVRAELLAEISEKATGYGAFTLAKPFSKQTMLMALDWMASARERLRRMEHKSLSLEEKMEEIRLINRAKWLLIEQQQMDEPQAHRWIEKQAMDRCITRRAVAEELLASQPD
ncbi:MAG: ANTAR domain-containing protein [Clostridia bacterium]|nr:ANTAR domain-containing protein [Clostridia bacterium]